MANKNREPIFTYRPFENLLENIKRKGIRVTTSYHSDRDLKPVCEEELFREAMKGVNEISEFRRIPFRRKRKEPLCRRDNPEKEALCTLREIVDGRRPISLPETQEYVKWVNPDCKGDVTRRLHEGKHSVQDSLDLHGLTVGEAEIEVEAFLKTAIKDGFRCVKIIHGRGLRSPLGPVLKDRLTSLLSSGRYKRSIAAFVTARQCDGGLGAVYVLLKSASPSGSPSSS